ncbi:MAG: oxygen-independent coproporphyrinogen III oxidase [Deltaproteobacteria bacterium]|jgi:oxygen-independent coproporphyrinogen-3 oxidase|nr:oxygen-independent coproporphyrinogen III oxidase [Deltaproteobacteria bacterium]
MKIDRQRLEELLPRYETAGPRYTSYPTAPSWQASLDAKSYRELLAAIGRETSAGAAISLYVHVPFCRSLCHFCACNRVITRKPELPSRYLDVVEKEIRAVRDALGEARPTSQLHLGGGTPTHLTPEQLVRLIDAVDVAFPAERDSERSIEVDPRVTSQEHVDALSARGFDRISMGVQDFDAKVQSAVHREQSIEQVAALVESARGSGFAGVNFDLIYGLPFQSESSFDRTLDTVIEQAPDRIALYSYAHVTWVAKQQRGFERHDLPSGSQKLRIMLLAIERLLDAGYEYIGMDHFARRDDALGQAARAGTVHRNFMGYTTKTSEDLIAFGPSGISELSAAFVQSVRSLDEWQGKVEAEGLAAFRGHLLSQEDRRRAWVIKQIMCRGGVRAADYAERFDEDFAARFAPELARLEPFERDGLVVREGSGDFYASDEGRLLVRNIAMLFDAYLEEQQRSESPLFSKTI